MKEIIIACDTKDTLHLSQLVPFQGKLKSLSKTDYQRLRREILDTGFAFPISVWRSDDGTNYILGGHQRRLALEELEKEGFKVPPVPVVYIHAADYKGARRRVLQDVSQYGRVGDEGLYEFMAEAELSMDEVDDAFRIPDLDVDLFRKNFFDDPTVIPTVEGDVDTTPPPVPKTVKGDVWTLGKHRLVCGDSTVLEDFQKLMGGDLAQCVWTDPPYNIAYKSKTTGLSIDNDDMEDGDFYKFLYDVYVNMLVVTSPGSAIYVSHADTEGINFRKAMKDAGWKLSQCLIWVKHSLVMGRSDYHWRHEPILYGWNPAGAHKWYSDRKQTTVLEFNKPSRNGEHPTMKPVELVQYCLENSSMKDDIVLDAFGGSGTTLIAAEQCGRKARLMEFSPGYCDVILRRYFTLTGDDPVREDGMKWSELQV